MQYFSLLEKEKELENETTEKPSSSPNKENENDGEKSSFPPAGVTTVPLKKAEPNNLKRSSAFDSVEGADEIKRVKVDLVKDGSTEQNQQKRAEEKKKSKPKQPIHPQARIEEEKEDEDDSIGILQLCITKGLFDSSSESSSKNKTITTSMQNGDSGVAYSNNNASFSSHYSIMDDPNNYDPEDISRVVRRRHSAIHSPKPISSSTGVSNKRPTFADMIKEREIRNAPGYVFNRDAERKNNDNIDLRLTRLELPHRNSPKWTEEEIALLEKGVKQFGSLNEACFASILSAYDFPNRTARALRLKWEGVCKANGTIVPNDIPVGNVNKLRSASGSMLPSKWTHEECVYLVDGVGKFGHHRAAWPLIREGYPEISKSRTAKALQVKWETLRRNNQLSSIPKLKSYLERKVKKEEVEAVETVNSGVEDEVNEAKELKTNEISSEEKSEKT
eukprot:Pgem_evm1s12839